VIEINIESEIYFTTGGLPPNSSSWRPAPRYSRLKIFLQLNHYRHSLHVTVVSLTAAEFKPLIFSISCFAFSSAANVFILIILPVRTSQETHYVSATKPSRLMLFREPVTVYCENRTEHTDTLCGQNAGFCHGIL
jgi:hypothetical protein